MGATSKIEWTDASWNPIRAYRKTSTRTDPNNGKAGWHCEHVSEGCRNCYAESMNHRLGTGLAYKPGHRADVEIGIDDKLLTDPLRWKRPRRIFVGSMTDIFANFVTDEMLDRLFAVMALCPQHTFQLLTKRPERMQTYFNGPYPTGAGVYARIADETFTLCPKRQLGNNTTLAERPVGPIVDGKPEFGWRRFMCLKPGYLPNVWLGTSCEDQETADTRIPHLLATPAAVRFLSCEPLLGPIDVGPYLSPPFTRCQNDGSPAVHAVARAATKKIGGATFVDWVIAGGESGHGARPMHPDWARSLRDQCAAAGVPFFFKQWGEHHPDGQAWADGTWGLAETPGKPIGFARVGKAKAGRLLEGIEHNAFPAIP